MTTHQLVRRRRFQLAVILLVPIGLIGGCFALDEVLFVRARPPENLKTIQDFQGWKRGAIMGKGTFEVSGVTYTVMLGQAGRSLPSGRAAYLFDEKGRFVDWTEDMGDCYTAKNHFKLTGGTIKNITHEKP